MGPGPGSMEAEESKAGPHRQGKTLPQSLCYFQHLVFALVLIPWETDNQLARRVAVVEELALL